jgi:hypothetical protein
MSPLMETHLNRIPLLLDTLYQTMYLVPKLLLPRHH